MKRQIFRSEQPKVLWWRSLNVFTQRWPRWLTIWLTFVLYSCLTFFSIRWSDSTGSRATGRRFPPTYRWESCDNSSFTIVASSGWVGGGEVARKRAWPHEAWRSFFRETASVRVENHRIWIEKYFFSYCQFSENQNLMCRSNNTLRALSFSSRTSNLIHPA